MSDVQKLKINAIEAARKQSSVHVAQSDIGPNVAPNIASSVLQEIFCGTGAVGNAFAYAKIGNQAINGNHANPKGSALLWVQEERAGKRFGRPYIHGLPPSLRHNIIYVSAPSAKDALWAMEEGLRCNILSAVIGELTADPAALDFTASRRLAVAAEKYGVPAFLLRLNGSPNLSGARERWRVSPRPSHPYIWDHKASGQAGLSAELFRSRTQKPGRWNYTYDTKTNRIDLVSGVADEPMDTTISARG